MDASSAFKDTLPTTPEALVETLENAGIAFTRHEHPPLRTVEESKGHRGDMVGTHVKNLYLRDRKKRNFLVVAQEDREIDLKALQDKIAILSCSAFRSISRSSCATTRKFRFLRSRRYRFFT